jgi:hypothetical protein
MFQKPLFCKGFANSTATFCCYRHRDGRDGEPYLSGRTGSQNLYYKRMVPLELSGAARPDQIWRSLKNGNSPQRTR